DADRIVQLIQDALAKAGLNRGVDDVDRQPPLFGNGRKRQQRKRRGRLNASIRRKKKKDFLTLHVFRLPPPGIARAAARQTLRGSLHTFGGVPATPDTDAT